MDIVDLINLIRARQWYKNLVIFLAPIFSGVFFQYPVLIASLFGFISLCLISSSNYIINDILDLKKDKIHPEKKNRPIASGKINIMFAIIISIFLLLLSLIIASYLSQVFFVVILGLFILNQVYSIFLKNEPFLDIIILSINFVIRAISGVFLIGRDISPWLILCPFFLALFISIGKRDSDLRMLKEEAFKHKEVLPFYTPEIISNLLTISTTLLIMSYSLYAFLTGHMLLLTTLPVSIYVVFRYLYLINTGSPIPRNPEKMFKDKRLFLGTLLWIIMIFLVLYI